jgi:hypothetical protein
MIPKFEIVEEFEIVQEVPSLKTMPETLSFKTIQENNIIKHIEKIDVSKYTKIELIDARKVCSNPTFKYAIILPLFGGLTYLYPDEISNRKYFLNEKEIKLPTDSIEHLYIEMYKLIHNEYIKSLLEEL